MNLKADWREELATLLPRPRLRPDFPLAKITTLRIGGPAECLVEPESEEELLLLFDFIGRRGLPFYLLGRGSNVLAPDGGMRGVVMRLGRGFCGAGRDGLKVSAGAGGANGALLSRCSDWGLGGLEFLSTIPGTVGGAIAMNAGAHGGETARLLRSVRYFQLGEGIIRKAASEFAFSYRRSPLQAPLGRVVLEGEFLLEERPSDQIRALMADLQARRRQTQPREFPNCGSVFKNPPGEHAGRLVEAAGMKGRRLGNAQVSGKHANFIVNRGGAKAAEVMELIDLIQAAVYRESGIKLELELRYIGDPITFTPAAGGGFE